MFLKLTKLVTVLFICFFMTIGKSFSEKITEIQIDGNQRISNETIIMFSNVNVGQEINPNDINIILKIFTKLIFLRMFLLNFQKMSYLSN